MTGVATKNRRSGPITLIVIVACVISAAIAVLAGAYVVQDRRVRLNYLERSSQVQAQLIAEHISAIFRQTEIAVESIATAREEVQRQSAEAECVALSRLPLDLPGLLNAAIVDQAGHVACTQLGPLPAGPSLDEVIRAHRDDLSGSYLGEWNDAEPAIVQSARIDGTDGSFEGFVLALTSKRYFVDRFREYGTLEADLIGLYDVNGHLLASWPEEDGHRTEVVTVPLLQGIDRDTLLMSGLRTANTPQAVVSIYKLPGFPYRVIIAHSIRRQLSAWRERATVVTALTGILAGILVVSAFFLRAGIRRRLDFYRALAESSDREQAARIAKLEGLRRLAGGLAHEVNNQMMVVIVNAELLNRDAVTEKTRTMLSHVRTAAQRVAGLSDKMLAAAEDQMLTVTRLDLRTIFRRPGPLSQTSNTSAGSYDAHLPDEPLTVEVDESLIVTAIRGLLENAWEAAGPTAVVSVTCGRVLLENRPMGLVTEYFNPGPYIQVAVEDRGPGMDSATASRVFEPFFTTRFLGRGMGLPAVAGVVHQHGGLVALDTAPGRGTRIAIYLPAARAE